jgi:hypothetical protein
MRKIITLFCLVLMFSGLGLVTAETLIAGKIYNHDFSETVSNATVIVTCNGHDRMEISKADGSYGASYLETGNQSCDVGNNLSVYAIHPSYGENTVEGIINDKSEFSFLDMNLGVVNVPLVPEFGAIVGLLTIISAVSVFFFVRRE